MADKNEQEIFKNALNELEQFEKKGEGRLHEKSLREKFEAIESLALNSKKEEAFNEKREKINKKNINQATEHVEEIVMWKNKPSCFNHNKSLGLNTSDLIRKFENNIKKLNSKAFFSFSYSTDIVTLKIYKKLEQFIASMKSNSEVLSFSPTHSYNINVEASGSDSVTVAIKWEISLRYIQKRQSVVRQLYRLKCRCESSDLKISVEHNRKTLEISDVIGLRFTFVDKELKVNPPLFQTGKELG